MLQTVSEFGAKVALLAVILSLLPESPFVGFTSLVTSIPFIAWVNWFLPISEMLVLFESLLVAVSVFYGILYLLNYVGVLKS